MRDPFEELIEPLPFAESAAFFLRLKTAGKAPMHDKELYAQCVKLAASEVDPAGEIDSAENLFAALSPLGRAQLAAAASVYRQRQAWEPDPKKYVLAGSTGTGAVGAGLGALASTLSKGRVKPRTGAIAGGLGGYMAGAAGGAAVGKRKQQKYQDDTRNIAYSVMNEVPAAYEQAMATGQPVEMQAVVRGDRTYPIGVIHPSNAVNQHKVAALKLAFARIKKADVISQEADEASAMAPPSLPDEEDISSYLAEEEAAREMEELGSVEYYAQKLREAKAEIAALQEQLAATDQELAEVQGQLSDVDGQIMGAQQEGQLAQQAAIHSAQTAHSAAADAVNRVVEAEGRALQATQDAAQARLSLTRIREALLNLASEEPPGVTGTAPAPGGVASGYLPQALAGEQEMPDMQGQQAAVPKPGAPEGSAAPQRPLSSPAPGGGVGVGGSSKEANSAHHRVIGGALGSVAGLGLAATQALRDRSELEPLQKRVADLEILAKKPGLKGFTAALRLAKERSKLTLGEATHDHPVFATITGGVMGAQAGMKIAPALIGSLREAVGYWKRQPKEIHIVTP